MHREFLLQLAVGVSDLFSKKVDKIKAKAKDLEGKIQKLDNTLKTIDGFKQLSQDIEKFSKAEVELSQKIKLLEEKHKKLNQELKETQRQYQKTGGKSQELTQKIERLKREIEQNSLELAENKDKLKMVSQAKNKAINDATKLKQQLQKEGIETKNLSKEYDRLQKELRETAKEYENLEKKLTSSTLETFGAKLKSIATIGGVGAAASFSIKGIIDKATQIDRQARLIIARTELTTKDLQAVKNDLTDIYEITGALPDQIAEVYTQFRQQTDLSAKELKEATIQALKLQKIAPEWDTKEITRAITQMQKAWGISAKEASDLIITAYQKAGDKAGDLLDTLWEYSPLMKEAGLNAKEFTAMLIAGAKEGAFNFDKLADTIKESFKARLTDVDIWQNLVGSGTKAGVIDQLLPEDKFKDKSRRIKHYLAQIREGIETKDDKKKKEGYAKLLTELSVLYQQDARLARNIMEQIFGTQGTEDLSAKILKAMGEASLNADKVVGNYQNATDKAYNELKTFFDRLNDAWRKLEATFLKTADELAKTLSPIGDIIFDITTKIAGLAESHPIIAKAVLFLLGVIATLGILGATLQTIALISVFAFGGFAKGAKIASLAVKGLTATAGLATTAIKGLAIAFRMLSTAFLTAGRGLIAFFASPMGLVVLAIGALIATLFVLYKNWNSIWNWIKEKFQSAKDFLLSGLQTLKNIFTKGLKLVIDFSPIGLFLKLINIIVQKLFNLDLKKAGQKLIQTFTDGILSFIKKPFEIIDKIKEKAKGILKFFGFGGEEQKADFTKIQDKSSHFTKEIVERTSAVKEFREIQQKEKSTKEIKLEAPININAPINITPDKQNPEDIKKAIIEAFKEGSTELKWALEQALKEIQNDNERYMN
ncbi:phage tail tape measure protein [Persephonella sp.]